MAGVGDHLHRLIARWTGENPTGLCGCQALINEMNTGGVPWTRANFEKIHAHIMAQAKARATQWRAVPVDERGGLLNTLKHVGWSGLYYLPGSKMFLGAFVKSLIEQAISLAEEEIGENGLSGT